MMMMRRGIAKMVGQRGLLRRFAAGPASKEETPTWKYPTFASLPIAAPLKKHFEERGFINTNEVQSEVFDYAIGGKDMVVRSRTGSGKTIAFALPIIQNLINRPRMFKPSPYALVLSPTRELALQIHSEFSQLNVFEKRLSIQAVYGGMSITNNLRDLPRGVDVLIATPGRLKDLLEREAVDFTNLRYLVLDETDEMLNIGFKVEIEHFMNIIQQQTNHTVQKLLFSATVPQWVHTYAKKFMDNDNTVEISTVKDADTICPPTVTHIKIMVRDLHRGVIDDYCKALIAKYAGDTGRSIIFVNRKIDADRIGVSHKIGVPTAVLHSDISQAGREKVVTGFKSGDIKCLVATNVAARGLDFPQIDIVIQVGLGETVETYIHRAGRTARAGKSGTCATIYTRDEEPMMNEIISTVNAKFSNFDLPSPDEMFELQTKKQIEKVDAVRPTAFPIFESRAKEILAKYQPEEAVKRLLGVLNGFTAYSSASSVHLARADYITLMFTIDKSVHYNASNPKTYLEKHPKLAQLASKAEDCTFSYDGKHVVCNVEKKELPAFETAFLEEYEKNKSRLLVLLFRDVVHRG
jgi:ATP-dependent RNA helicase DDX21